MADDDFENYQAFADYLHDSGWLTEEGSRAIYAATAAFQMTQRRAGFEAARVAMMKALDKSR